MPRKVAPIVTVVAHPNGGYSFVSAYEWHDPVYALAHTERGFVGYDAQGMPLYNPQWDFRPPTDKEYELLEKIDRVPKYPGEYDVLTREETAWIFRAIEGGVKGLAGFGETLDWRKAPSVTTGGKPYFWVGYAGGQLLYWVVWDRYAQKWAVTDANKTLAYFDSAAAGKKWAESH